MANFGFRQHKCTSVFFVISNELFGAHHEWDSYGGAQITTTSIFLPLLSPVGAENVVLSSFGLQTDSSGSSPLVLWQSGLTIGGGITVYDANVKVKIANGDSNVGGDSSVNANYVVATVEPTATPVPSTLVMLSIMFGMGGVGLVYRRFKKTVTAV